MRMMCFRQAEQAIAQGRLDEACGVLRDGMLRAHARGQELIGRLIERLVERSRGHLAAGRLWQAKSDADQALMFGGNQPHIAQLREAIANAIEGTARREDKRAQLLAAARQQIDRGRLALGEKWLGEMSVVESRAANLLRELDVKKTSLESALHAAKASMDCDDLASAARELVIARQADSSDSRVIEIAANLSQKISTKLVETMDAGRLDLADALARAYSALCAESPEAQQFVRAIEQCRAAWGFLRTGEQGRTSEILKRVALIFPSASWIETALEQVRRAEAALAELRCGPLALLDEDETTVMHGGAALGRGADAPEVKAPVAKRALAAMPSRFVLRVDGAGSFCVFRQPIVSIGPISSSQQPDLGLMAEPGLPVATIERREDEYFIRGAAVAVNDRPGSGKLLASGDRIALSPRCRMSFNLPSAASVTGVLDLTGCRYPRADVRRVILMDRDVILGASLACHVRVDDAEESVVLHVRDERLFCETKSPVEVNGAPMDRVMGIPMEAHVRVGALSFVVSNL